MTADLEKQLAAARTHLEPRWTEERATAVRAGMPRRAAVHRRRRVGSLVALTVALGVGGWLLLPSTGPADRVDVSPLAGATRWHEVLATPASRVFQVDEGGVWFSVTPRRVQVVRVVAGDVEVEVMGTRFLVERVARGVRVAVDHGHVRVRVAGGATRDLRDGEEGIFAPSTPPPADPAPLPSEPRALPAPEPLPVVPQRNKRPPPAVKVADAPAGWRQLAESGDFTSAWSAMRSAPPPTDDPVELLLAADVARLSHHPDDALRPLQRLIDKYPADPRAPLAAFTLGRVLLDELGRPREAAAAFATVRRLDPAAPLSEDSLAREVEARYRAGDAPEAHALAVEYQQRYPSGSRLRAVRHFGGFE